MLGLLCWVPDPGDRLLRKQRWRTTRCAPEKPSESIMTTGLRRLKNLNIDGDGAEAAQEEHENVADNENNESLQSPPDVDGLLVRLPHQPRSPIKIIWPNGEVRQIIGEFTLSNLLALQGGKVIVETDENGVPNERSASILGQHLGHVAESPTLAPLDIPRFDNSRFNSHKEQIIKDVELKFAFPRQTIHLTRDWILRTVNNRWRAYKSKLKKQYFNRDERTLEEILREKPLTTNEHQWRSLVGIWCQEQHKKLCSTNSRCAKEQKTAHTCGRKSLARLKKEMETRTKRKVHRIEQWEAAHKKKNGRYTTEKAETLMAASYEEFKKGDGTTMVIVFHLKITMKCSMILLPRISKHVGTMMISTGVKYKLFKVYRLLFKQRKKECTKRK